MELGLSDTGQPVLAMVSRLAWQKGIDLAVAALPEIFALGFSVVVLGSGEPHLEHRLSELMGAYPAQLRVSTRFDVGLSHRIEAAADFFLMPSRYEPCGLSQIYSLAYGTLPIVRATGGLWDTVRGLRGDGGNFSEATGLRFVPQTPQAIVRAVKQARALYENKAQFARVQEKRHAPGFLLGAVERGLCVALRGGPGGVSTGEVHEALTHAEAETEALGLAFARLFEGGAVIALRGDLAAGKTCFVRGMAGAFSDGAVHSPTFTLVNEYGGDKKLFHLDLYRLNGPRDLIDLGYEELFDSPHLTAVEWAERAEGLLPARRVEIALEHAGGDVRRIRIEDRGVLPPDWRARLAQAAA